MTDKEVVAKFLASRSESAFRTLYQRYASYLYQMAIRLSGHRTEIADDLLQETWITAIRKLDDFEWRSTLKTWLTSVLINHSRAQWRKAEMKVVKEEMIEEPFEIPDYHTHQDLENAISSLPEGYREVIVLHDVEGFKHREIADMLNVSEGTSKSQLFHARKAMITFLGNTKTAKG